MTIEQYNNLPDLQKKHLLVDANKIDEFEDEIATYEMFRLDDFYIEVSRSVTYKFRKILNTYSLSDVPHIYSAKVLKALV